ncbi:hypothetical protein [Terriglobus saanensis]|uniref:Response regulator receiver n=1 Tax=Terriglobus saanensis (strain ATCC BAA-1853 / DSM 23119 / SP1PR4) TaxID=401053 RepID=E8V6E9_TERSS|nr:hypothetical protein [Terriglobus saanensis]ADV81614.1 hypothetical protein AciPR4_0781 [Terriglobus saanensis SP1PR4]
MKQEVHSVLILTAMEGAENLAGVLSREADVTVQVARNWMSALAVLRREAFTIVLVDSALAQTQPGSMETLWERADLAVPLELNIAELGADRLIRQICGILARREQEYVLARKAAGLEIEEELRSHVTGLLLESDLMLSEQAISPIVRQRLVTLRELADGLRVRLRHASA